MANTANTSRQSPLHAMAKFTKANLGANGFTFDLPAGAFLLGNGAHVVTAFDSATTATITATDGTTTLINAQSIKAAALTDVTVAEPTKYYPSGGTITVTIAETGTTATVGEVVYWLSYIVLNRHHENA